MVDNKVDIVDVDDVALLLAGKILCPICGWGSDSPLLEAKLHWVQCHVPSDVVCSNCEAPIVGFQIFTINTLQDQEVLKSWLN